MTTKYPKIIANAFALIPLGKKLATHTWTVCESPTSILTSFMASSTGKSSNVEDIYLLILDLHFAELLSFVQSLWTLRSKRLTG